MWRKFHWVRDLISNLSFISDIFEWLGWKPLVGAVVIAVLSAVATAFEKAPWYIIFIAGLGSLLLILAALYLWVIYSQGKKGCLYIAHSQADPWLQTNLGIQDYRATAYTPGTLYTYRIAVGNKGGKVVHDVEVKLTSVLPKPPRFNSIGGNLQFRHQAETIKMKDIHPTKQKDHMDAEFVDVLRLFRNDAGCRDYLMAATTVPGQEMSRLLEPIQTYRLTVTVTGHGGHHAAKDFEFIVKDDALPIFRPI